MSDLVRLTAMDPLELAKSEKDIRALIVELRERRKLFNRGISSAGKVKSPKLTKKEIAVQALIEGEELDL